MRGLLRHSYQIACKPQFSLVPRPFPGEKKRFPRATITRKKVINIRASVDALCRDGTSEISRDPRTKRLQTRRESLGRPSKHTNNNLLDSYLAVHKPSSFLPASSLPRENPLTRDFHNFLSSYSSSSSSLSSSSSSVNPLSPY